MKDPCCQQVQLGANLGEGEQVFARAFTPAAGGERLVIPLPPRPGVAAWLLSLQPWPTANGSDAAYAFTLVNAVDRNALTSILNRGGGAPNGGTPLAPSQPDVHVVSADRDSVWVDVRGIDNTLALDANVTVEVEVFALYATPKCPAPLVPDCNAPPEKRKGCQ